MVNQRDLAKALGLSQSTVSRALAGSPEISPDIRNRVREYAKRTGYRPWKADLSVLQVRDRTISVLNPGEFYIFENWARVIRSMQSVARYAGYRLRLDHNSEYAQLREEKAADGFIVLGEDEPVVNTGNTVYLDRETEDGNPRIFSMNNEEGGRLAARHLIGLGHKHLCFFGYIDTSGICKARYRGWLETLSAHGLDAGSRVIHLPDWAVKPGEVVATRVEAVREALNAGVTGFLAPSDGFAMGLMKAVGALGLSIPGDVSVVGYDDSEVAKEWNPPLTTVRQPLDDVAEDALNALMAFIDEGDGSYRHETRTPVLVVRESTAPVRDQ